MLEERSARKRHVFARALLTTCSLSQVRPFDPFEILGVTHGATEKDIKRAYRQLSLKFHPDKVRTCFAVALPRPSPDAAMPVRTRTHLLPATSPSSFPRRIRRLRTRLPAPTWRSMATQTARRVRERKTMALHVPPSLKPGRRHERGSRAARLPVREGGCSTLCSGGHRGCVTCTRSGTLARAHRAVDTSYTPSGVGIVMPLCCVVQYIRRQQQYSGTVLQQTVAMFGWMTESKNSLSATCVPALPASNQASASHTFTQLPCSKVGDILVLAAELTQIPARQSDEEPLAKLLAQLRQEVDTKVGTASAGLPTLHVLSYLRHGLLIRRTPCS